MNNNQQENINQELNLARKLRPRTFSEVVGQDLTIRILKNGLYLKKYFPLYIFSGQRGCGKTSTARIFASAINCENLSNFQTDPKSQNIPCIDCDSCRSMQKLNHPDFIEIDAASHTGVDNVRQILDSAVHVPLIGAQKVYLIDEAHMLSKAAFNAFLKMLEEPPDSVLFILATTELQKIPDTVRSRAFQLFFQEVDFENLKKHLVQICSQEKINIDDAAIDLIIQQSEGSVRDAINLIERVRLLSEHVSSQNVLDMLGKVSYSKLFKMFDILLEQEPARLLSFLDEISFEKRSPQGIWDMLVLLCRYLVWLKYNIKTLPGIFQQHINQLRELADKCSVNRLNAIMQIFYSQENLFLRTSQKHMFLETVLLQICQQVNVADLEELINMCKHDGGGVESHTKKEFVKPELAQPGMMKWGLANSTNNNQTEKKTISITNEQTTNTDPWEIFLKKTNGLNDKLLATIFLQAKFVGINKEKKSLDISLKNDGVFFQEKIKESTEALRPLIDEVFLQAKGFNFNFVKTSFVKTGLESNPSEKKDGSHDSKPESSDESSVEPDPAKKIVINKQQPTSSYWQKTRSNFSTSKSSSLPFGRSVDISDVSKWPKANLLVKVFPGKIEKVVSKG